MKALTLDPIWAMKILGGEKTIEHRTWKTNYRGDILICSSAKKRRGCISGHGLIVGRLVDCVPFTKEHLEASLMERVPDPPGYAWLFDDWRVVHPVPVKGQLSLFNVDAPIEFVNDDDNDIDEEETNKFIETELIPLIYKFERP